MLGRESGVQLTPGLRNMEWGWGTVAGLEADLRFAGKICVLQQQL